MEAKGAGGQLDHPFPSGVLAGGDTYTSEERALGHNDSVGVRVLEKEIKGNGVKWTHGRMV